MRNRHTGRLRGSDNGWRIGVAIALTACLTSEAHARGEGDGALMRKAEAAMAEHLPDPGSAKFRNVIVTRRNCGSGICLDDPTGPAVVCGEVNAKNGFDDFPSFMYWDGHLITSDMLKSVPTIWNQTCTQNRG